MSSLNISNCFFVVLFLIFHDAVAVNCFRVNITKFSSCDVDGESSSHSATVQDITYEFDSDGYCDTIHGTYFIPTVNIADKLFEVTIYRCRLDNSDICSDNIKKIVEHIHCDRFHTDKTGPWSMISDGMSASKCGELVGEFSLNNARLKPEYVENFIDPAFPRNRMNLLIRKKSANSYIVRGCIDIEFDIKY